MNALEDKIRAALRETAGEIPPHAVPPLRLTGGRGRFRLPAGAARWGGWLTPLAAAASVGGVVAASLAVAGTFGSQHHAGPPARPAAARQAGPFAGLPPYYVTLTVPHPRSIKIQRQTAVIRATATGRVIATISAPRPDDTFVAAAGAGDSRTFVLAAAKLMVSHMPGGGSGGQYSPERLFLLRLRAGGQPALTALPIPPQPGGDLALSPDGSKLALGDENNAIHVFSVATGAERTWTWPGGGRITNNAGGNGEVLSWSADDRTLAYQQWAGSTINVWLLDATAPGGRLPTDSQLVLQWKGDAETWQFVNGKISNVLFGPSAIITPDGSKIVAATASESRHPLSSELMFTEFSAATGQPVTVLGRWPLPGKSPGQTQDVLWSSRSGDKLIVVAHLPGVQPPPHPGVIFRPKIARYVIGLGVQTASGFTPLPGAPGPGFGTWPVW